jgi:tetratricopeptide (TPR) repeat protein
VNAPPPAPPPTTPKPPRRAAAVEKPSGPKALVAEGRRLRDRGRPQEALDVYARALAAASEDADALAGRGLCYLDLSQYRPAESSFEEALRADATHPDALMGLAETYRYEGRRAEAVTYYQRYLAAHPQGRDAAAARSAIEALKE